MINVPITNTYGTGSGFTYTNTKGGLADLMFWSGHPSNKKLILTVDGVTVLSNVAPSEVLKAIGNTGTGVTQTIYELKIPFTSSFSVFHYCSGDAESYIRGFIYVNK